MNDLIETAGEFLKEILRVIFKNKSTNNDKKASD